MRYEDTIALVTGANRGIGLSIVEELLERGAKKIYLGVRDLDSVDELVKKDPERLIPLQIDLEKPEMIRKAFDEARDINLLVNNAGILLGGTLFDEDRLEKGRKEMEVNFFGPLQLIHGFIPHLRRNGEARIINVSSVGGQVVFPGAPTYCASKFAIHGLTQALRMELMRDNIHVMGVYPGPVDTRMAEGLDMKKAEPREVAREILKGLEERRNEVFPDDYAREMHEGLRRNPEKLEEEMARSFSPDRAVA